MITSPSGISVSISPWLANGAKLTSIRLYEEIGGKIANGVASFEIYLTEAAIDLIYKQCTGKITVTKTGNNGNILEIEFFVTKRKLVKNSLTIEFLCVKDSKFFTELVSLEHTDITQALNSLYPGKIDIRCESDVNNEVPLIQFNETNYDFCNKLAFSFKKDIIFAYGWEGFLLKDRCGEKNSMGKTETVSSNINNSTGIFTIIGGSGVEPMDPYLMKYDNRLFYKVFDPWLENEETDYTEKVPLNLRTLQYYNNYLSVGTDYTGLVGNYLYNNYMMTNNMQVSLRVKSDIMPNYKLGDVVVYGHVKEQPNSHSAYLVKTNELYYSPDNAKSSKGGEFFWVSTLVSLFDPNGNIYPWETDPMLELDDKGKLK